MTVQGLENNFYLINNPIYLDVLDINSEARYITISVGDSELRLYTGPSRKVSIDLRDMIKGMFPEPQHPEFFRNGDTIYSNAQTVDITITESVGESILIANKTFIRGGLEVQRNNVTISPGGALKVTEKMPVWKGFPFYKYILQPSGKIEVVLSAGYREVELQRVLGRNPIYVRFLNAVGGYSFWLFENFTEEVSSNSFDNVTRRERDFHLGVETTTEITLESRVKRPYFNLIKSLLKSPEVHIYQKFGNQWTLARVTDNSISLNNYEDVQQVSVTLSVGLTERTAVKW